MTQMEKEKDIIGLLQKFNQGNLSPEDGKRLSMLMHQGDSDSVVCAEMENSWQESSHDHLSIPSDEIWNRLKQNISPEIISSDDKNSARRIKWMPFLKYAAVFILAVGLTWFAKDFLSTKSSSQLAGNADNNVITVSYGSKSKVILPDGSRVCLNSGSTLRYPAKFSRVSRNVYVEGEAFFDVRKDPLHPFYVKTRDITIKVLGTKFNVKSYADEKTIQATLVCGSIEVYSNKKEITEQNRLLALKPNQQVTIETKSKDVKVVDPLSQNEKQNNIINNADNTISVNKQIDVAPIVAWKDNRLVFRDENFVDLSKKLERWYDVVIEIKDPELKTALFSGVFVKETVEQALEALKLATPFRFQMKKNQITISK
jgi:transmembrane sensor